MSTSCLKSRGNCPKTCVKLPVLFFQFYSSRDAPFEYKRSIPRRSLESAKAVKSQLAIMFYTRDEFWDGLSRDTQSYSRAGVVPGLPGERLERSETGEWICQPCLLSGQRPARPAPVPASASGSILTRFPARLKPRVAFRTAAVRG